MYIKKLNIKNFKQFKNVHIDLNKNKNIFIGENGSGKSTILEAISYILTGNTYTIEQAGIQSLFNVNTIQAFMKSNKCYEDLPIIEIEAFIENTENNFKLTGIHNSERDENLSGLKMIILPNDEYSNEIKDVLIHSEVFPFDYYKVNFRTFQGQEYNNYNRYLRHFLIDSTKVSSKHAQKRFIEEYYRNVKKINDRTHLQHKYREQSQKFTHSYLNDSNDDGFKLTINSQKGTLLEDNLTIQKSDIDIANLGKGDSMLLNIEFALSKTDENTEIILIEEPENHLSYLNMNRLINKIDQTNTKQVFIATHNNMIVTRLELQNAIFLNSGNALKLDELDQETSKFFQKSPSNNILNFILAKKVILVEGDAEFILFNSFYKEINGNEMYEDNIALISVGGLSFKRYLNVAKKLNKKVAVITDNDGNYTENIKNGYADYINNNIAVFAPLDSELYTLEKCLYVNNSNFYEIYLKTPQMINGVFEYMINSKNKAEAAYRTLEILEKNGFADYTIPDHIKEAFKWVN